MMSVDHGSLALCQDQQEPEESLGPLHLPYR